MNDHQLRLRVTNRRQETADATSFFLKAVDGHPVPHRAGQFLTLILQHRDGGPNSHEVRRSYSLSSATHEPLRLTIKRVPNGEISRHLLDSLQVGDELVSLPPAGRFTVDPAIPGDLILIGAGSGISPLFAMLKQELTAANRRVTLLYSNTSERSTIFREELTDWQSRYPDRLRIFHLLSNPTDDWAGLRGRLNNVMLERLLPTLIGDSAPEQLQFYVCGPADYMRMVTFTLVFSGFTAEQIRRENFVIEPVFATPTPTLSQDRTVLLRFRNRDIEIQVPAYKSILQAALDEGLALPYSCRGGRCSTCAARCRSGKVHMTINDVLTARDLADGWVLTCTGYPESDGVVLDL